MVVYQPVVQLIRKSQIVDINRNKNLTKNESFVFIHITICLAGIQFLLRATVTMCSYNLY